MTAARGFLWPRPPGEKRHRPATPRLRWNPVSSARSYVETFVSGRCREVEIRSVVDFSAEPHAVVSALAKTRHYSTGLLVRNIF